MIYMTREMVKAAVKNSKEIIMVYNNSLKVIYFKYANEWHIRVYDLTGTLNTCERCGKIMPENKCACKGEADYTYREEDLISLCCNPIGYTVQYFA